MSEAGVERLKVIGKSGAAPLWILDLPLLTVLHQTG